MSTATHKSKDNQSKKKVRCFHAGIPYAENEALASQFLQAAFTSLAHALQEPAARGWEAGSGASLPGALLARAGLASPKKLFSEATSICLIPRGKV